jgi:hypothetical protein
VSSVFNSDTTNRSRNKLFTAQIQGSYNLLKPLFPVDGTWIIFSDLFVIVKVRRPKTLTQEGWVSPLKTFEWSSRFSWMSEGDNLPAYCRHNQGDDWHSTHLWNVGLLLRDCMGHIPEGCHVCSRHLEDLKCHARSYHCQHQGHRYGYRANFCGCVKTKLYRFKCV